MNQESNTTRKSIPRASSSEPEKMIHAEESKPMAVDEDHVKVDNTITRGTSSSGKKTDVADIPHKNEMENSIKETEKDDETMEKVSGEYLRGSRKGDPRMNKAVEAKHADTALSLLDALLIGGFKFPGYDDKSKIGKVKMNEQEIYDENGITMRQRKNQLGRRLRSLRCQEEVEKKYERQQQRQGNCSSSTLDLSRALGEIAPQNNLLGGINEVSQMNSQFSSIENGLLQALAAATASSSQNMSSTVGQHIVEKLLPRDNLASMNLLTRPQSGNFNAFQPEPVYSQSVPQQVLSNPLLRDFPASEQTSSYLDNHSNNRQQLASLLRTSNPCSPRPPASSSFATVIPSHNANNTNQQEQDLQKQLLLLLKNEYIHRLAQAQDDQRQDLFNQEEVQKILSSAYLPSSNTVIANDLVHHQLRSALATGNSNVNYKQKMVSIVEDDSSSYNKEKKRTSHSTSLQTKSKKHKTNQNSQDNEVTPSSSPRLMSAMKTFHEKFDAFTHSCMEEAGYTKDESMELFKSFQKKVIGEITKEKK